MTREKIKWEYSDVLENNDFESIFNIVNFIAWKHFIQKTKFLYQ